MENKGSPILIWSPSSTNMFRTVPLYSAMIGFNLPVNDRVSEI